MEEAVLRIAAPVLLLIGLLIMIGGTINGSSNGIIAGGGVLVVIGAGFGAKKIIVATFAVRLPRLPEEALSNRFNLS